MKMRTGSMLAAIAVTSMSAAANADDLLLVDLSVPNQITITATAGLAAATVSDTDNIGVYFREFFGANTLAGSADTLVSGDLVSFGNTSDGTPDLFHFTNDPGLNFWSWTNDAASGFTMGSQAFSGSATWSITPASFSAYTANNPVGRTGDLFFPADSFDDIAGQGPIGTWRIVPTPGAASLMGIGLIASARRRR